MKKLRPLTLPMCLALLLLSNVDIHACTTFILSHGDRLAFGRNLDWHTGIGLIIVNKRNVSKVALISPPEKPAEWVSKYGSITFNQVGRELPYGGINEAGLVVEHMTLDETQYPGRDSLCAVNECQWIQYHLDNCSTVQEVIESSSSVRIAQAESNFHFLICDRSGDAATIEFLNGDLVCHTRKSMLIGVLANSTYAQSLKHPKERTGPIANKSLENFVTAADMVKKYNSDSGTSVIDYSFGILKAVSQGPFTKWSIVYDIENMKIYYRTYVSPGIKIVDIEDFDFSCSVPSEVVDLNIDEGGLINKDFVPCSTGIDKDVIFRTFNFFRNMGFLTQISDSDLTSLAEYPESFECVESPKDREQKITH